MNELYTAPELNIVTFVPAENLAARSAYESVDNGDWKPATPASSDVSLDF